jgi:hypothetical protein
MAYISILFHAESPDNMFIFHVLGFSKCFQFFYYFSQVILSNAKKKKKLYPFDSVIIYYREIYEHVYMY